MFKVEWKEEAIKGLARLDKSTARKIRDKVHEYLAKNPTEYGKQLVGNLKGLWSFRFSDYRVIYQVKHDELIILVLQAEHRREVYKKTNQH